MISAEAPVLFAKVSGRTGLTSPSSRPASQALSFYVPEWKLTSLFVSLPFACLPSLYFVLRVLGAGLQACELFILELTLRSWMHSEESKRRTLQRNDIAAAITKTDVFDFLLDIVPREEAKEEASVRMPVGGQVPPPGMYGGMPYAYMQQGMPGGEVYQAAIQQQLYGQYGVPGQFPPMTGGVQQQEPKKK